MIINGKTIDKGQSVKISTNIARLPSHTPIDISISVNRAEEDGPVLLLMGGLHGDEINGIEIVRRIMENDYNVPKRGTVICMPVLNIYGFINYSRDVPDGKDINRSFPGNKNGSLAARVANYLTKEILPQIDYGVDFHTGGSARTNYPQLRCVFKVPKNLELAKAFHPPITLNSPYVVGSLRQTAGKMGKHILVYEGGESLRFDELAIQEGINGSLRLMKHLGMRDDAPNPTFENKYLYNSSWVRAKMSGLFQSMVLYGETVMKGQTVGVLSDTFGDYKKLIKSTANGVVIGLNNNPVVHQGDALMHIGTLTEEEEHDQEG